MNRPWGPSDPGRWSMLGMADPDPSGVLPKDARTAEALAWALCVPGAADPVEGILDAVRIELDAIASVLPSRPVADALNLLSRRIDVAALLLRRADNRERNPMDLEGADDAPTDAPPFDPETTQDAPPSDRGTT